MLLLALFFPLAAAYFSKDFGIFLEQEYNLEFREHLERRDLGRVGSFGGRESRDEPSEHTPILFVHGVSDTAGERMKTLADIYRSKAGYSPGEVFGTTYYDGAQSNPLQWTQYAMRCEYVKQVRAMLLAVRLYTGKNIAVVSYSLGVPVVRKAILGGQCVDTQEDLGVPLTRFVHTFIGIAGPNNGIAMQVAGFGLPTCALGALPICDRIIGLYSGLCPQRSLFLEDLNRKSHFEGREVYSIYSRRDETIGYRVCDEITASMRNETGHASFGDLSHDLLLTASFPAQQRMLQGEWTGEGEK